MHQPKDTRARIVTAARQRFAEKGFAGATTAEIARRAGVAEGTIYRHFQDKKELFIACVAPAVEEALRRGREDVAAANGDLRSMVRLLVASRMAAIQENLDSFTILFTEASYHPELADLFLDRVLAGRMADINAMIEQLSGASGLRRPPNLLILGLGMTVAMWAILTFQGRAQALESPQTRLPLPLAGKNLVDDLTDFMLYGIAGQPSGGDA